MNDDEPIAFFITWTVYRTFLQGDERGWRRRKKGNQDPQPKLASWRRERLKHTIELLGDTQQSVVEAEIGRLAGYRGWHVWTKNARTNHVHAVVTASGYAGSKVPRSTQGKLHPRIARALAAVCRSSRLDNRRRLAMHQQ